MMADRKTRPAMRGRYLIRNPVAATGMALTDLALRLLHPAHRGKMPVAPQRILLADWAHIGDAITTLGALRWLKARYPGVKIGMICSSWNKLALAGCADIDDLFVIDHFRLNRAAKSKAEKKRIYQESRLKALPAIRAQKYQVGIDLYPYFPPAHPVFLAAGIPLRIGFESAGLWPLLTHAVPWVDADRPVSDYYRDLLAVLSPENPPQPGECAPRWPRENLAPLPDGVAQGGYIVLHPGAGAAFKDWGRGNWRGLCEMLRSDPKTQDQQIVITGYGAKEKALAEFIAAGDPAVCNLVGRYSWDQFLSLMAGASVVVCPDTVTGHAAALFETPTVSIFTGVNNAVQWGPANPEARVVVKAMPCSPCNTGGCSDMCCIKSVEILQVYRHICEALRAGRE